MTESPRRWLILTLASLVAMTLAMVVPASPASAEPGDTTSTADDGDDQPLLNDVLDSTGRRFLAAKAAVAKSTNTQLTLAVQVREAEAKRDALIPQVGAVAGQQYRTGGISTASFLLDSNGADNFLRRAHSPQAITPLNKGEPHQ